MEAKNETTLDMAATLHEKRDEPVPVRRTSESDEHRTRVHDTSEASPPRKSKKTNYKAKWRAAVDKTDVDPQAISHNSTMSILEARRDSSMSSAALQKVRSSLGETIIEATDMLNVLDASREVAGLNFGVCTVEVDAKLPNMPAHIAIRRVRDVLKLAQYRVGILSAAVDDYYALATKLGTDILELQAQAKLCEPWRDVLYAGLNANDEERREARRALQTEQEYHRYGLEYKGLSNEWDETRITQTSVLRQQPKTFPASESEDSDNDSDEEEIAPGSLKPTRVVRSPPGAGLVKASVTSSAVTHARNRSAHVLPTSPVVKESAPAAPVKTTPPTDLVRAVGQHARQRSAGQGNADQRKQATGPISL